MKLSINRDLLIKAINMVVKAADKRHRYAILANIKLSFDESSLMLTASDLEMEMAARVPLPAGACIEMGETTLPAEMFFNIVKSLSDEAVLIDAPVGTTRCTVTSGHGKYTLSTLPAADFPSIGAALPTTRIRLAHADLASLIYRTRFAMATQDVRHYLTGMLLEIEDSRLTAVATDGHRLAVAHRLLADSYPASQVIVPGKAVTELERLLAELSKMNHENDELELGFDGVFLQSTIMLNDEDAAMEVSLTARLIEGKFPDYRRVLPTNNDKVAQFDKEAAIDVLRRISVLNTKDVPGVLLNFSDDKEVSVRVNAKENEAEEVLAVNYTGEPLELSFNEAYLRAVLSVLSDGAVRLSMNQPSSPALIDQPGDELHQYVVMPMRI